MWVLKDSIDSTRSFGSEFIPQALPPFVVVGCSAVQIGRGERVILDSQSAARPVSRRNSASLRGFAAPVSISLSRCKATVIPSGSVRPSSSAEFFFRLSQPATAKRSRSAGVRGRISSSSSATVLISQMCTTLLLPGRWASRRVPPEGFIKSRGGQQESSHEHEGAGINREI